ncbi:hypothetical protein [Paracoccus beibuensis]|uniref:hypothetical protein n=1 Tax=Paracoccus beibuensis TaxID=547602 RepID=UPI00223F92F3|nr:hypothetical protein [Paracoccus beibuensis]
MRQILQTTCIALLAFTAPAVAQDSPRPKPARTEGLGGSPAAAGAVVGGGGGEMDARTETDTRSDTEEEEPREDDGEAIDEDAEPQQ